MREKVSIFALGGLEEIGKNMYGIQYGDEIIVVDCGRKFADEEHPGVESLIPDIRYLIENRAKVKGIFLTHGHEDHIGGLPYVLPRLKVPVYGAPLSIRLARAALKEHRLEKIVPMKEVTERSKIRFDRLSVSFFRTSHSIPDSLGIVVHTPEGPVVHTGDFKFDLTPVGPALDFSKITEVGKKRVLALLSDSTNSEREGATPSDRMVGSSIEGLFRKTEGRIFFATFASNVHRLQQVVETARAHGRKVALLGFSMEKVFTISRDLGHVQVPDDLLVDIRDLHRYEPDQVVILCTGSQGEPNSALVRIAMGTHPKIKLQPEDTVILSSSPIPGNTRRINRMIDHLFRSEAEVVYGSQVEIHASGHGSQQDQLLMLRLIHPRYFIPIHGEYRMLVAHGKLAEQTGISPKNIFLLRNGDSIGLTRKGATRGDKIPLDLTVVDGHGVENNFGMVLKDRRRFSENGLVLILFTMDKKRSRILAGPEIVTRGFVYVRGSEELIEEMKQVVRDFFEETLQKQGNWPRRWKTELIQRMDRFLSKRIRRAPVVLPVITTV